MEIKTCEQYVLDRLEKAEMDVESLKVDNMLKDSKIRELEYDLSRLKNFVKNHMGVSMLDDEEHSKYITFDSPWERYDSEEFAYITAILDDEEEEGE